MTLKVLKLALARMRGLAEARRRSGRSMPALLAEIARLRFSRGRIGVSEYLDYGLYERRAFAEKAAYVGWRASAELQSHFVTRGWGAISSNKLIFYTLCTGFGLPHARLIAAYLPGGYRPANVRNLSTLDDIRAFLADPRTPYPMFGKPVIAWHGSGSAGFRQYDAGSGEITLINGEKVLVGEFVRESVGQKHAGYLWQELLAPHPAIVEVCGHRLCTLRVWLALEAGGGATILNVQWKVAVGRTMIDNTAHGTTGNYVGPVDLATGKVIRLIFNAGLNETQPTTHPDTGRELINFTLPDWEAAMALCKQAAACFYGFRVQAWDIALTDRGPVLVELNMPADIDGPQHAFRAGMWDERFDRLLANG